MKYLTYDKLNKIANMNLSEFVEKYTNINLLDWQKSLVDNYNPNITYFLSARGGNRRLVNFYGACRHLLNMKEDDIVMVAKPDGWEQMNKDEFANYLLNRYW